MIGFVIELIAGAEGARCSSYDNLRIEMLP